MDTITLTRSEWAGIARELDATYRESAPPGLRARIAELLDQIPAEWADEPFALEMDAASATAVRAILRQARGEPADPGLEQSQRDSISEAERIVRDHQIRPED